MKRKPETSADGPEEPTYGIGQDAIETRESFLRSLFNNQQSQSSSLPSDSSSPRIQTIGSGSSSSTNQISNVPRVPQVPQMHLHEPTMVPLHALPHGHPSYNGSFPNAPPYYQNPSQHQPTYHSNVQHQNHPQHQPPYHSNAQHQNHPQHQPPYHSDAHHQNPPQYQPPYNNDAHHQNQPPYHNNAHQQHAYNNNYQHSYGSPYHMYQATGQDDQGYGIVTPSPDRFKSAQGATQAEGINAHSKQYYENPKFTCNCMKSRCLKLYCDCFRQNALCNTFCKCEQCLNLESQSYRGGALFKAKKNYMARKPEAFGKKKKKTGEGCSCRNNRCLKKYCDCFRLEVACRETCTCLNCANISSKKTTGE